ncbi:MAG: TlpA family protein disulfide reductase [Alphaproteobacteria bacterium]|nr:TlpA family protein disulfide reductase [Alphaproteobacteria bacterium]
MRSGRPPVLAFVVLVLALMLSAALLLIWAERSTVDQNPVAAEQTPLGHFVPAASPRPAPPVSFTDIDGKTVHLSDFAGKVVLLNLWATWCAPCRHEMPSLEQLQAQFGDKLAILPVSQDLGGNKVVAPFVSKLGLAKLRVYADPKSTVGRAFKVEGLPTTFLIDQHGRVLGRVEGEAQWNSSKMLAVIEPLVASDDIAKTSSPQAHP